ncbi:MAG: hypothetical protein Q7V04_09460, partial [Deltaproteobacteria bacterium]|nr:hypothetical protein [Deltaproteobacteria bacterium]
GVYRFSVRVTVLIGGYIVFDVSRASLAHNTIAPYSRTAAVNKDKLNASVSDARSEGLQIS